ncbi:Protein of unknown function [Nonlabens sp. Hel1_33_55]|uniref:DUF3095 family protein n=1 Tax=Nonlabens sp. Hel1_33_55 TaxID=1336802 RepID=UPI000875B854|nr:DUF3095 family protein [Nonlabens sp. Hel1_33_55]SCY26843.1 Protein of unknown function [Nonlabens sp. Hel1_33_55]
MENSKHFYANLKAENAAVRKILRRESAFVNVPNDWHVVVADVQNSTAAVNKGLHNNVNLAATGSVATVMNIAKVKLKDEEIPYFFGGDGVTFLTHQDIVETVITALKTYKTHVKENLHLILKVGSMPVSEIYEARNKISIAKCEINDFLNIPVLIGNGLKFAERQIKDNFETLQGNTDYLKNIDLKGMECRWEEIAPRNKENQVVCLLALCSDEAQQATTYAEIMDIIHLVFGDLKERQPITTTRLKLNATVDKIRKEMMARLGKEDMGYLMKNWLITYFGTFYFKFFKEGKQYLSKVSQLSDTIMFDGTLNTVMEGSPSQIESLRNYLDMMEREGRITYGIHTTYASVMSCYVQDRKNNHVHFVDGTEGGYTSAAVIFKNKLGLSGLTPAIG